MTEIINDQPPAIVLWFRELLRGPVVPSGDYFDRLRVVTESSAPVFERNVETYPSDACAYARCGY